MTRFPLGTRPTTLSVTLLLAALLTLGAAAIHFAVTPPHLREYLPFGAFFIVVACAQVMLAVELLVRPTRRLALGMAIGSAGLVGLWFVSRTVGLPIGPQPWTPEETGLTDVICNLLEIISTLLFVILAIRPPRRRPHRLWRIALASLPTTLLVSGMTAVAVAAELNPMPEAVNFAPARPGATVSVADLSGPPAGAEHVDRFTLVARPSQIDGQTVWTLNGSVPGPELHVTQGDRVQVTLQNELPESTTLHWHGLRIPNAEDGVAGLTQDAVPPGQSYTYEFVATDAGTYWYHSHQQTDRQLTKGLFGALVVAPAGGRVAEDIDDVVLLHGEPGHVRINGQHQTLHLAAQPGQTVRLRLIDAVAPSMDGGPETPVLIGAPARVVALDGHDLNAPQSLGPTRLPLGMGQRADVVFTMPPAGSVELRLAELQGQTTAVQNAIATLFPGDQQPSAFVSLGDGAAPDLPDLNALPLFDATQYGTPSSDSLASGPYDVERQIVLGERGGIRDGASQLVHTIDGQASPNVPPLEVSEGQRVHLHIVNDTDEYHPMHLHGHIFSLLATDGQPISGSPVLLDSVLVGPRQTVDVAFVADNPGIWMFHCHVLLHASMGMMMTINYSDVYTPYEMGTRSGNMPE